MPATITGRLDALITKLKLLGRLDPADTAALASLPVREETARAGTYLVREGMQVVECCVLLKGYACRNKLTSEGRRQIVSFHIPGDVLDLQHLLLDRADHNVQVITDCTVARIPAEALRDLARARPNVATALWRDTLVDASIFREWVLNVGQRDARARIAHMLCEFAFRRSVAGLGEVDRFELPMTQEQIADATGMTPVHVNRMLGAMRADGLISRDKRQIEISDWAELKRAAGFDPAYLHLAEAA
jgi:CRP-like cAMP-binding protein